VRLRDFFDPELISLNLQGTSREEVIKELVSMLALDKRSGAKLYKMCLRRRGLALRG